MSETIPPPSKLAKALLAAQRKITRVIKDSENPYFKSKYADLSAVISHVKPILNGENLVFIQMPVPASRDGYAALTTTIMHEDGESVSGTAEAPLAKNDPQAYGSAITYLRRYSLTAATGLMIDGEDDDGESAVDHSKDMRKPSPNLSNDTPRAAAGAKKKTSLFPVPKPTS